MDGATVTKAEIHRDGAPVQAGALTRRRYRHLTQPDPGVVGMDLLMAQGNVASS
jgi:hypothetical protein